MSRWHFTERQGQYLAFIHDCTGFDEQSDRAGRRCVECRTDRGNHPALYGDITDQVIADHGRDA